MSIPWSGSSDPAPDAGWQDPRPARASSPTPRSASAARRARWPARSGTRSPRTASTCSGSSYDNTGALGASTWRHVAFIEQPSRSGASTRRGPPHRRPRHAVLHPAVGPAGAGRRTPPAPRGRQPTMVGERPDFRWLMSSDVCKHCTHAACLDVCPTGSLFRTEFGTVVVQDDICNGCGYCVPACPYGVIERRHGPEGAKNVGIAQKCTLCYDRLGAGQTPACAQACPTESIQFGDLDELRERADARRRDAARRRGHRRPALRRGPRRRRRRRRRVLPAARRARGLRPAAGPGRHHPRPAATVAPRRPGRGALLVGAVAVFAGAGREPAVDRRPVDSADREACPAGDRADGRA